MKNELLLRKPEGLHVGDLVEVNAWVKASANRALYAQAARIASCPRRLDTAKL